MRLLSAVLPALPAGVLLGGAQTKWPEWPVKLVVGSPPAARPTALADPELLKKFAALGLQPVGSTAAQTRQAIANDIPKWTQVVKEAGITLGN